MNYILPNSNLENPKNIRLGAIALSLMALLLPACTSSEVTTREQATENVTAEEVADETSNYIGQTVTIRGDVEEVVGEASFLMNGEQTFGGGEEILIVNASGKKISLPEGEGTQVQVTGEVRNFVIAEIEREYNLDFEPNLYTEYEQQPALIAKSIALSPDPGDLSQNPEKYYYQRIAVQGEVEEIRSTGVFTLDEEKLFGSEDLLVITNNPDPRVNEDESVTIVGTLRPFVQAEFDRDYNLTWDLDVKRQIEAEYQNKPVFVADEVYPSAL